MLKIQFELAGVSFRRADYTRSNVQRGDALTLKPEPGNIHDPNAIAVYKNDIQIGYVPRMYTGLALKYATPGAGQIIASAVWPRGCWIEIHEDQDDPATKNGTVA